MLCKCRKKTYQFCTTYNGYTSYYYQALEVYAVKSGFTVSQYDLSSIESIDNKLKSGKCMGFAALEGGRNCKYCYSVGHFIAFYTNSKKLMANVNDPSNKSNIKVEDSISNILYRSQSNIVRIICRK